jgi:hypothetical protein
MKMLDREKIAEILREKHPYLVSEYGIIRSSYNFRWQARSRPSKTT